MNISGTELPQVSEHQLSVSNRFHGALNDNWNWFVRADYTYNSERFAQVYNLASTGSREIVNARLGVSDGTVDIELWGRNLTDDDTPVALLRYVEPSAGTFNPFNRAIVATLPEKRAIGATVRISF